MDLSDVFPTHGDASCKNFTLAVLTHSVLTSLAAESEMQAVFQNIATSDVDKDGDSSNNTETDVISNISNQYSFIVFSPVLLVVFPLC